MIKVQEAHGSFNFAFPYQFLNCKFVPRCTHLYIFHLMLCVTQVRNQDLNVLPSSTHTQMNKQLEGHVIRPNVLCRDSYPSNVCTVPTIQQNLFNPLDTLGRNTDYLRVHAAFYPQSTIGEIYCCACCPGMGVNSLHFCLHRVVLVVYFNLGNGRGGHNYLDFVIGTCT